MEILIAMVVIVLFWIGNSLANIADGVHAFQYQLNLYKDNK
jgi:hypothetical protein